MKKKYFKFTEGRQRSGYERMKIFSLGRPLYVDCYLTRVKAGAAIRRHKDPMRGKWKGKKHYRLNFVKPAKKGGIFSSEATIFLWNGPVFICFFRPDICWHEVSQVEEGARYALSFGWAR